MDITPDEANLANEAQVLEWLRAHDCELFELTAKLVSAPSVTGNEGLVSDSLVSFLEEAGLSPELDYVTEEFRGRYPNFASEKNLDRRPNVYGWYRCDQPTSPAPFVLNGHIDVVPEGEVDRWTFPPFSGRRHDGKIWGRGSADMKGPVAAGLMAVKALKACGIKLPFDVQVQMVIGEETGGIGSLYAIETQPKPQAAIVLEPSENRVVSAGGGSVQFTVSAIGRSAHGCIPWTGVSAIEALIDCYLRLDEYAKARNAAVHHPLFEKFEQQVPYSIGTFNAGNWRLSVPESGNFSGRLGVLPGESNDDVRRELAAEIEKYKERTAETSHADVSITWPNPGFKPWETSALSPLVSAMQSAASAVGDDEIVAVTYGSDAGHFAAQGVPVIIYGPGTIEVAHMDNEYIGEEDLSRAAAALALALMRFAATKRDAIA